MPSNVSRRAWPTRLAIAAGLTAAGLMALASPADAAEDLTALLDRPVSPGSVALLAEHALQPAAQKRLAEAVKHESPAVRAVAARLAFVTMSKGLAPALISTLAKEEHAHTAAEQVRALMALLGAPGDSIVLSAVKRIGGPTAIAMAELLARTRPMDIARHLPTLTATAPSDLHELGVALATACAQHPSSSEEILRAVMTARNEKFFREVLAAMRDTAHPVPPAVRRGGMPDLAVALRVQVSHTGCVSSAETMRSVLPAFDLAAIQSMFTAKWTPATLGGEPVDAYVTFIVRFTLRR
jgi:hypothetical protein